MLYHQNSAVLTLLLCVVICLHLVVNVSKEKLARILLQSGWVNLWEPWTWIVAFREVIETENNNDSKER